MDIAGVSMALSQVETMGAVSVAMLSNALETNEQLGSSLVSMMDRSVLEQSVTPYIGSNIDLSV